MEYVKFLIASLVEDARLSLSHILNLNPLCANLTKGSNTLKQFVGNLPTNCLSKFDHFVKLALKGLKQIVNGLFRNQDNSQIQSFKTIFWIFWLKLLDCYCIYQILPINRNILCCCGYAFYLCNVKTWTQKPWF